MIASDRWAEMLPSDPRPWLLASDDPAARWIALTRLLDVSPADANALAAHRAVLSAHDTERLLHMVEGWRPLRPGGCPDARYRPYVLCLLADMGVDSSDDERIVDAVCDFNDHRDASGRFLAPDAEGGWEYGPCEHAAVAESILHAGLKCAGFAEAVAAIKEEFIMTSDGRGWGHPTESGEVGPACPVGTTWALRLLSTVPRGQRPRRIRDGVRTLLRLAERTLESKQRRKHFTEMPWPPHGDSAFSILDVVGRYTDVWDGPRSRAADRGRVVALLTAFLADNFDDGGIVVVRRPSPGFGDMSMAKKGKRSALATAAASVVVRRFEPLVDDVAQSRKSVTGIAAAS